MQITKIGHSCLLIEEAGVRLLSDPGVWNPTPEVTGIDAILITHEHPDHCDPAQLKTILEKNPAARVITHKGVGVVLAAEGIAYEEIGDGEVVDVNGVSIESCGSLHALIYGDMPRCQNTGYVIAKKLFLPGDALHDFPKTHIEVLALPVGGPWVRGVAEVIDYAKQVKPTVVFPIHDAMYVESFQTGLIPRIVGGQLEAAGITFTSLTPGTKADF